eukprot:jgi/Hompol1/4809/HPOL_003893-RA
MVSQAGTSLLVTLAIDFGIQLTAYIISAALKTERFYDLSGSLTFIACTLTALLWRQDGASLPSLSMRQIIAAAMVLVWSTRLGAFLFMRVLKVEDKRFDEYKKNPLQFAGPFFIQVLWIFFTAFPVFTILANPSSSMPASLVWSDILGIVIWVIGFVIEVEADAEKSRFKADHPNDFVYTGIWAFSRNANYFGEMTLWIGVFILCIAGFAESWQWITITSPLFVISLISFVSGIPISEKNALKRYGNRPDYIEYRARTSKLIPWFPKRANSLPDDPSE